MGKEEWVTVKEASEKTGYSLNSIYGLIKRKVIKTRKNGKRNEIELNSLISYYERKVKTEGEGENKWFE